MRRSHEPGGTRRGANRLIRFGLATAAAAALAGCGGTAANPPAAGPPSPLPGSTASHTPGHGGGHGGTAATPRPPKGFHWVGGASLGLRFAAPRDWAAVNLAKESVSQAVRHFSLKGVSGTFLRSALRQLSKEHALYVADLASAVRSPHHFATNANGFCTATTISPGAGSVPALESAVRAEYAKLGARVLSISNASVGGQPGARGAFTLTTSAGLVLTENQYMAVNQAGKLCTVTLTTDQPAAFHRAFREIGGSIRFS